MTRAEAKEFVSRVITALNCRNDPEKLLEAVNKLEPLAERHRRYGMRKIKKLGEQDDEDDN